MRTVRVSSIGRWLLTRPNTVSIQGVVTPPKASSADNSPSAAASSTLDPLQAKLAAASKDDLVRLIERLVADSTEISARLDYLTDPDAAAKALQRRIGSIRSNKRFVGYAEARGVAADLAVIAADISADVLPKNPLKAAALAEKLFSLDDVIFDRADDSDGVIGDELRAACVLWLDAGAAARKLNAGADADWAAAVYDFYQANDYGVREPLLEEAHRLLDENELRALAARFERDARNMLAGPKSGGRDFHDVFAPSSAMGLIARALRDPLLHEQSIRIHSPEPNELQAIDIASHYVECGDAARALRWLGRPFATSNEYQRLSLLDRAYALLGDRARQIDVRRERYRRAPGIHTYRALEEILPTAERSAFRAQACQDAKSNPHAATAAELLFALEEPCLAEELIIDRANELDGRNYVLLTSLAEAARASGCWLAATIIWRALLDAILARGYAKAYGHGARYLRELRAIASEIEDFHGYPAHADYERSLRMAHGRKTSFWQRLSDR
jgi:hypothetical protein